MAKYLFDEDLQGPGDAIYRARKNDFGDTWVIGNPPCPIPEGTPDEDWFPIAARERLIVFRKDTDILNHNSAEGREWRRLGCQGFVLTLNEQTTWPQVLAITRNWSRIKAYPSGQNPNRSWVARVTATTVRPA